MRSKGLKTEASIWSKHEEMFIQSRSLVLAQKRMELQSIDSIDSLIVVH